MSALDSRIDELYQGPLDSFTASRNALAKTLTGDEKRRVSALPKPLAIPWIVNQTYWHARGVRRAPVGWQEATRRTDRCIAGRSPDIRAASDRHAEALTEAMSKSTQLAKAGGVQPQADALRRMLEAVSTRASLPAEHGRFVKPRPADRVERQFVANQTRRWRVPHRRRRQVSRIVLHAAGAVSMYEGASFGRDLLMQRRGRSGGTTSIP